MNCLGPFYSLPLTIYKIPFAVHTLRDCSYLYVLLATITDINNNSNFHSIHPQYNGEVIILHFTSETDHKEWFIIKNERIPLLLLNVYSQVSIWSYRGTFGKK